MADDIFKNILKTLNRIYDNIGKKGDDDMQKGWLGKFSILIENIKKLNKTTGLLGKTFNGLATLLGKVLNISSTGVGTAIGLIINESGIRDAFRQIQNMAIRTMKNFGYLLARYFARDTLATGKFTHGNGGWQALKEKYLSGKTGEYLQKMGGAFKKIGGVLKTVAISIAGFAARMIGKLGPVGLIVAATVGILVFAFVKLTKAVYGAAKAQLDSLREFAKLNGQLAQSFAISDFLDIIRNMKYAEGIAGTTSELNEAFTRLKDALLPIQIFLTNLWNRILTWGVKFVTAIINGINWLLDGLGSLFSSLFNTFITGMKWIWNLGQKPWQQILDEEKKAREEERKRAEQDRAAKSRLPVEGLFRNILDRKWGAIMDTRPPLFGARP